MVPGEGGGIAHAQLVFGNGMVMLGSARDDAFGRMQAPMTDRTASVSQSPYIVVSDVDAHHARAALLHESELARTDPGPQFLHRPMRYDIGRPITVI